MSMIIADVGGANPFNTSTIGHKVNTAPGWTDPVEYKRNIVTVPGGTPLDLGGSAKQPRIVTLTGYIKAATRATLETNFNTLISELRPGGTIVDIEISLPDDADIILVGQAIRVDPPSLDPTFVSLSRRVSITIEAADPHKYDVSGGYPGTALP